MSEETVKDENVETNENVSTETVTEEITVSMDSLLGEKVILDNITITRESINIEGKELNPTQLYNAIFAWSEENLSSETIEDLVDNIDRVEKIED